MSRNPSLPSLEVEVIEELSEKAEEYDKAKNARLRALGKEVDLKADLIALMKRHKKKVYRDGDLIVEINEGKENLKVRHAKEEKSEQ